MPPQNSYVEILTPKYAGSRGEAFERCISHKGEALMSGIGALIRDPIEMATPFCQVRTQRKDASYELGRGLSPKRDHACALILDFQPPEREK